MHKMICLLLLFITMNSKAQTNCNNQISGKVIDVKLNESLPFAKVELLPVGKALVCNDKGEFIFDGLCTGTVVLKTYYIGFDTLIQSISLEKNIELKLRLNPSAKELKQTEIVAKQIEGK